MAFKKFRNKDGSNKTNSWVKWFKTKNPMSLKKSVEDADSKEFSLRDYLGSTFREVKIGMSSVFRNKYVSHVLAGVAGAGLMYGVLNHKASDSSDSSKSLPEIVISLEKYDSNVPNLPEELLLKFEEIRLRNARVNSLGVSKDFSLSDIKEAGRGAGLTGILGVISDQKPVYSENGNIDVLGSLAGISLFDEDPVLESNTVASRYHNNGINDVLTVEDVELLYSNLKKSLVANSRSGVAKNEVVESGVVDYEDANSVSLEGSLDSDDSVEAGFSSEDYKSIASTYNASKNKAGSLDEIADSYSVSKDVVKRAVIESKDFAGVNSIKYSSALKGEFSTSDSALLVDLYLNNTVSEAKRLYKEITDVDLGSSFYRALDGFCDDLGLGKVRKSKLDKSQKSDLSSSLKEYIA